MDYIQRTELILCTWIDLQLKYNLPSKLNQIIPACLEGFRIQYFMIQSFDCLHRPFLSFPLFPFPFSILSKLCILKCTTWCFGTSIYFKTIVTISLIITLTSLHMVTLKKKKRCVWWERVGSPLLATFKHTNQYAIHEVSRTWSVISRSLYSLTRVSPSSPPPRLWQPPIYSLSRWFWPF